MDLTTVIKAVIEVGITATLLVVFVKYFIDRDKRRDKQLAEQQKYFQDRDKQQEVRQQEQYKNFRERENILIAESTRREELLKTEAEKREKLLKDESAKRERELLITIDGFSKTMQKISDTMSDMKDSNTKMKYDIAGIKGTIERMQNYG